MADNNDQRCTPFLENMADLIAAVRTWIGLIRMRASIRFLVFPSKESGARVGHEAKNVVRELWRKWTGKCPS